MRKLLAVLVLLTGLAGAGTPFVDPDTGAQRVFDIPVGASVGLTMYVDTLHVTTDEKGWDLTGEVLKLTVINPNNNWLLWRESNAAGLQCYIGAYGTDTIEAPGMVTAGLDSLFVDGEAACTVYIRYWSL